MQNIINGLFILIALACLYVAYDANRKTVRVFEVAEQHIAQANQRAENADRRARMALRRASVAKAEVPLGIRNNNPGNVKGNGWAGQRGNDSQGHAIFETPEHGLRAAAIVLKNYQKKHGLNTLREIVSRYAEGNQESYAKFLAARLGVKPDDKIDVLREMPKLLEAIVHFELGEQPFPRHTYVAFGLHANM